MGMMSKTITFVVPAYNMETYLERCINSLVALQDNEDIEVIIVDDGSTDGTASLIDTYARRMPSTVKAIHEPNRGHGGAVNTGIAQARGVYVKVVDADDWVGPESLTRLMGTLRSQAAKSEPVDLIVTDYVYDKLGRRRKHVVRFNHVMNADQILSWNDLRRFGIAQYMIMHALIFRTKVVRDSGMRLPEHTFYVDFIYAYQPFPWVRTIMYLDTPLYHYFIGRNGQSVQTDVMIRRVGQLLLVNHLMALATPSKADVPAGLYSYMIHFLAINSVVTSVFLILSRDRKNYEAKRKLWEGLDELPAGIGSDVRRKIASRAINLHGPVGRWVIRWGYRVAERMVGFN
ncbi:MAG: glycosyltransferase family 2 protein [Bifidobacterium sp.]